MPQLSIIIPFCNEKEQVEKTVISIIENSITSPEIILIDDASDDFYDYFKIAKKYGCVFVHHANRKGVAGSRNEGVNVSTAANFLFLDAHMKMYEKAFDANLIKLLEENDKCVLCAQTISIDEQHNIINNEVS
jgi:glycosyltransferase involved in cell wall biosynthesis